MVVAVAVMGAVQMAVDEVVHMIAMRDGFVATIGTMGVGSGMTRTGMLRCADIRIGVCDG